MSMVTSCCKSWACGRLFQPQVHVSVKGMFVTWMYVAYPMGSILYSIFIYIVQALRVALLRAPPNTFFEDTFMWSGEDAFPAAEFPPATELPNDIYCVNIYVSTFSCHQTSSTCRYFYAIHKSIPSGKNQFVLKDLPSSADLSYTLDLPLYSQSSPQGWRLPCLLGEPEIHHRVI